MARRTGAEMFTADELAAGEAATRQAPRPPEVGIVGEVLSRLGTPAGLRDIQVRAVSPGKYRVNVYVSVGASCRVAHSFFVEADGRGGVLSSSPPITRAYP